MSDSGVVAAMVGRARELDAIDRALHAAAVLVGHLEEHAGGLRF